MSEPSAAPYLEVPRTAEEVDTVRGFVDTILGTIAGLPPKRRAGAVDLATDHARRAVDYGCSDTMTVRVQLFAGERRALITVAVLGRGGLPVPAEADITW